MDPRPFHNLESVFAGKAVPPPAAAGSAAPAAPAGGRRGERGGATPVLSFPIVQLITTGDEPQVRQVPLDANNTGEITVLPPGDGERLIVAVAPLAEKTRQSVGYALSGASAQ